MLSNVEASIVRLLKKLKWKRVAAIGGDGNDVGTRREGPPREGRYAGSAYCRSQDYFFHHSNGIKSMFFFPVTKIYSGRILVGCATLFRLLRKLHGTAVFL